MITEQCFYLTSYIHHEIFSDDSNEVYEMAYNTEIILVIFLYKWQTWEDYGGENSSSYINILYKPHWWCNGRLCVRTSFGSNQTMKFVFVASPIKTRH
jgi:hypothetical protein